MDKPVENIVATVSLNIENKINLDKIIQDNINAEYNPEKFPGLIIRLEEPKATIILFSTGKMVITGLKDVYAVEKVVEKMIKIMQGIGIMIIDYQLSIHYLDEIR